MSAFAHILACREIVGDLLQMPHKAQNSRRPRRRLEKVVGVIERLAIVIRAVVGMVIQMGVEVAPERNERGQPQDHAKRVVHAPIARRRPMKALMNQFHRMGEQDSEDYLHRYLCDARGHQDAVARKRQKNAEYHQVPPEATWLYLTQAFTLRCRDDARRRVFRRK